MSSSAHRTLPLRFGKQRLYALRAAPHYSCEEASDKQSSARHADNTKLPFSPRTEGYCKFDPAGKNLDEHESVDKETHPGCKPPWIA